MGNEQKSHPDEIKLELFILGAGEVEGESADIEAHLDSCEGCRALRDEMVAFYADVEGLRDEQATAEPDALAVRDRIIPYRGAMGMPASPGTRQPLPVRMVASLVSHPVRTSMGVLAVLAMLIGVNYKNKIWKDPNPFLGRALSDSLIVFNADGERLWSTWIGYRNDLNFIPDWFRLDNWIVTKDFTGDGVNEVISCLPLRSDSSGQNYMASWNADGTPRWEYEFHRNVKHDGIPLADQYRFLGMIVDRFVPGEGDEIIAVVEHEQSQVRAIIRLDAETGAERGTIWHVGNILQFKSQDMNGDGLKEFYFSGTDEGSGSAFLGVLDPRYVDGLAPKSKLELSTGPAPGTEKFYVQFPHPEVETEIPGSSVVAGMFSFAAADTLVISILTKVNERMYVPLEYHFNPEMVCTGVTTNQEFINYHREMEKKGFLKRKYDGSYLEEMRKQVRYWDGEKFVYEPVTNIHHPGEGSISRIQ